MNFYEIALVIAALVFGICLGYEVGLHKPRPEPKKYMDDYH